MIIYKDLISGDELFSDQFKTELLFDCLYKVEAKLIKKKLGVDESNFAFNASAEGGEDESVEDGVVYIVDLLDNHKLEATQFGTKKEFQSHIKGYMKRLKETLEKEDTAECVTTFTKNAPEAVKHLLGKFKDLCFYVGASMNYDGMIPVMENEGEKYMFYFFKHGLIPEKV